MNQKLITEALCHRCGMWFESPVQFENEQEFKESLVLGGPTRCRCCGLATTLGKKNMRVIFRELTKKSHVKVEG